MSCVDFLRELLRPGAVDLALGHQPLVEAAAAWTPPLEDLPSSRKEVYAVFGDPGHGKPSKAFQRQRMVVAKGLPGDWNKGRGRLYCHELAEPYLREALRRAELAGALGEVERIGCYVHRHQRHDVSRPLSYHSWGIAIDINPAQNRARNFSSRVRPVAFSPAWREWWPFGLSEQLVECFESVGWSWGGRWRTFVDPMHFELVG